MNNAHNLQLIYTYESDNPFPQFDSLRNDLYRNGINADQQEFPALKRQIPNISADVVLATTRYSLLQDLYANLSAQGIALISLVPDDMIGHDIPSNAADAYCLLSQPPEFLAALIWCVWRQRKEKNELEQKCSRLEKKLEDTQLIGQAKTLLAKQLQISEGECFRGLRSEARRSQRKIADLAKCIVEAERIRETIQNVRPIEKSPRIRNGS